MPGLSERLGTLGADESRELVHGEVEHRRVVSAIRSAELRERLNCHMSDCRRDAAESSADAAPRIAVLARRGPERAKHGQAVKGIQIVAGSLARRRLDLVREARSLGLQRVLQAEVQINPVEQIDGGALEARPLLGVDLPRRIGLPLDLLQMGRERLEREIAIRALTHAKKRKHFRVVDEEHRLRIGDLGPEEHVEEPLVGADSPAFIRECLPSTDEK